MRWIALTALATLAVSTGEAHARPKSSPPIEPVMRALNVKLEQDVHLDAHQREVAHRAGSRLLSLCPDCRLGTIDEEGPCGWARVNRGVIKSAVAAGHDEEAIVRAYVATYGEEVLAIDTDRGWAAMTWIVPYALIAMGLGLVWIVGRRARARERTVQKPVVASGSASAAYAELQDELSRLD